MGSSFVLAEWSVFWQTWELRRDRRVVTARERLGETAGGAGQ